MTKTGKERDAMKIAIVEDDINMRKSLEIAFSDYSEYVIESFKNARDAIAKLDDSFELVISDINMPGMDGLEFVKKLGGKYEVIVITGNATLQKAITSIQLGVKDFLLKPFDIETLVGAIRRNAVVRQTTKTALPSKTSPNDSEFVASSPALNRVLQIAQRAARTDASVLLLGESGVGKELFARYIHAQSPRAEKPFVAINMAAIPDNLIESELFGYEKGAFTDATETRAGQFEAANGGTLFLDEIGEMPHAVQAKLLRALQEREIRRLGSSKAIPIDIRIVSATNADLDRRIAAETFREDLYYRLNTIPLQIPPLRERKEEIIDIAETALQENCDRYALATKRFGDEAQEALLSYDWPGNVRELISVVERAAILSETEVITPDTLFLENRKLRTDRSIESMEKELISEVINTYESIDEAARILGMSQNSLKKKVAFYRL
jgi:two-component system NtrC family response regulator